MSTRPENHNILLLFMKDTFSFISEEWNENTNIYLFDHHSLLAIFLDFLFHPEFK